MRIDRRVTLLIDVKLIRILRGNRYSIQMRCSSFIRRTDPLPHSLSNNYVQEYKSIARYRGTNDKISLSLFLSVRGREDILAGEDSRAARFRAFLIKILSGHRVFGIHRRRE